MHWYLRNPGVGDDWAPESFGNIMYGDKGLISHAAFSNGFANPCDLLAL